MKNTKGKLAGLITGVVFALLTVVFIVILKNVDVQVAGASKTKVGLATINSLVADKLQVNMLFYKISQYLGYFAILIMVFFAICGVLQLIKKKSIFKVNRGILILGGLYVILFIVYFLFEIFVVNLRPVILPGEIGLEASFPSSHTMLALVTFYSAMVEFRDRIGEGSAMNIITIVFGVLMLLAVVTRLLSGAHWLTDIIGGILISISLCGFYRAVQIE